MPLGRFLLPSIVDPPSRIAVCICIPDEQRHIAAFWGALRTLGYQFAWERDDAHTARDVSTVWARIVDEANENFNAGGVMCVNQNDLETFINNAISINSAQTTNNIRYGDQAGTSPDEPSTVEQQTRNLAGESNPGCDLDVLWAQCVAVINYSNTLITDVLERCETATNDVELITAIGDLPLINEFGIAAVGQYINLLLEGVAENYAAQYTQEYRDRVTYDLFCRCVYDCKVTVERVWELFKERIEDHFGTPMTALGTIFDLWQYLTDQSIDGTIVCDAMMSLVWGGGWLANTFLGDVGTQAFEILLQLAVNDASNDWEIFEGIYGECTICFDTESETVFSIVNGSLAADPVLDYVWTSGGYAEFKFTFPHDVTLVSGLLQVQSLGITDPPFTLDEYEVNLYDALDNVVGTPVSWSNTNDGNYTWFDEPFTGNTVFRYAIYRKHHVGATHNDIRGSLCVIGLVAP